MLSLAAASYLAAASITAGAPKEPKKIEFYRTLRKPTEMKGGDEGAAYLLHLQQFWVIRTDELIPWGTFRPVPGRPDTDFTEIS
jgi:hypothetical protein